MLTGTWISETVCNEAPEVGTAVNSDTGVDTVAKDVWIVEDGGGGGAEVGG